MGAPPVAPAGAVGLPDHVAAFLRARLKPDAVLCVGLSGGRDSVALLQLCRAVCGPDAPARYGLGGIRLTALHVHHGLAAEADAWADFCRALCAGLGVPLERVRVQVPQGDPAGLEGAARAARYGAFQACGADALALAHHRDDQAETLLFRLLRGSGVAGAAAMAPQRCLPRPGSGLPPLMLLRPLLDVPRNRLVDWLAEQGSLGWIDDPSNADLRHARNFLRHAILPEMATRFPQAGAMLARAAGHFAEAAALLDERAAEDFAAAQSPAGRLSVAGLAALSPPRRRNLLRYWLRRGGAAMPDEAVLREMERQFVPGHGEAPCIRIGAFQAAVWRGELFLEPRPVGDSPMPSPRQWRGESEVAFGAGRVSFLAAPGQGVAASLLADGGVLRSRQAQDRMRPGPGRPRRDAQRLFQEAGIPPWRRAGLPVLEAGGRIVWLAGVGVDSDSQAGAEEAGVLPVWHAGAGLDQALE